MLLLLLLVLMMTWWWLGILLFCCWEVFLFDARREFVRQREKLAVSFQGFTPQKRFQDTGNNMQKHKRQFSSPALLSSMKATRAQKVYSIQVLLVEVWRQNHHHQLKLATKIHSTMKQWNMFYLFSFTSFVCTWRRHTTEGEKFHRLRLSPAAVTYFCLPPPTGITARLKERLQSLVLFPGFGLTERKTKQDNTKQTTTTTITSQMFQQANHHHQFMHTLLTAPKQGGVLQSSGFLDFQSLISLGQTAKANLFDERSLILLIENQYTRHHGARTMEQAMMFLRNAQWMGLFPYCPSSSPSSSPSILHLAVHYEVLLAEALASIPAAIRFQAIQTEDPFGRPILHSAACSSNSESINTILSSLSDSERWQAVNLRDDTGKTVLHCAASSGNIESIQLILSLYPQSEHIQALNMQDRKGTTALHYAAGSGNHEALLFMLNLLPESMRLQAVSMVDQGGRTALHHAASSGNLESVKSILSICPELQSLCAQGRDWISINKIQQCP